MFNAAPLLVDSGAVFSPCRQYRYALWRKWASAPIAAALMLNPSTADESANDPTVERVQRRMQYLGYGGFYVLNIFAFRSTDPRGMLRAADPIGPQNNEFIVDIASRCDLLLCAWGEHGRFNDRSTAVKRMLVEHGLAAKAHALGFTRTGEPRHPLYLPYSTQPERWIF